MREIRDFFTFLSSRILTPGRKLVDWEAKNFRLQTVKLPNSKLTKDLEKLCLANGGALTFGEFISEEMFGKNGFYNTHNEFGKTPVDRLWPEAILNLCQKNSVSFVVEIGSGDGALGKETLELAKKKQLNLSWTGIEINQSLWKEIQKNKPQNFSILNSVGKLKLHKTLVVFPYSLDSMPSEVIINNAVLGIKINGGILEEVLLSASDLKKRGISFKNGIFKINNYIFDFSSWILRPNQRAYLPISGLINIIECVKKMNKSSKFLIIDEMKPNPKIGATYHLGTPRVLNSMLRDYETLDSAYKNTGNNLWYFPMYQKPLVGFLEQLGFTEIVFDGEAKTAANLKGESVEGIGPDFCRATVAELSKKASKNNFKIPLPF
jgi:hypothetical protein